jgi:hypothetical protein
MIEKWKTLPMDIVNNIFSFGVFDSPHHIAYKNSTIRPVFSCELNSNISGEIKLDEDVIQFHEAVNEDYLYFLLQQDGMFISVIE